MSVPFPGPLQSAARRYPGAIVAILLAFAAFFLAEHYGAPVMLFALLLGMAVNFLGEDERCRAGIDFCAKTVLRTGVALLGLRITAGHLAALGWWPILLVFVAVVLTIGLGALLARGWRLGTEFGVLTGTSVAICGASAAIAVSAVLPTHPRSDKQLVFAIIGVTTLSTLAMIIYPTVAGMLGMGELEAGVFLGGTIHDVAQVVGAGYSVSERAGDLATIVKLLRVTMLVPVVFTMMLMFRQHGGADAAVSRGFPAFLLVFILLAAINSLGLVPVFVTEAGNAVSRGCLVVAIAAVGVKTALREVVQMGWAPVMLMVAETLFIAVFVMTGYALLPRLGWL